jgi:D-alanine-D-alanine ligase
MAGRIRLVVLFGGRSAEHDISCISAFNLLQAVDPARYDVVPVGITRSGQWVGIGDRAIESAAGAGALPSPDRAPSESIMPHAGIPPTLSGDVTTVVFPLLHGPMGEDGTVQGLLELSGLPYVGSGVLGSALCMDKGMAKEVLRAHAIPQARWITARSNEISPELLAEVQETLGLPLFVKPANLGSSIGISRASTPEELEVAVRLAQTYDEFIVFEEAVRGREIEVAILGDLEPRASIPGEIVCDETFYGYEEKYINESAKLLVPAPLTDGEVSEVQALAIRTFTALRAEGLARVDFFLSASQGFLVNEVNTMPGFTPISMYPMLWAASGLDYAPLVDELVRLALARHARRSTFTTGH